MSPKQKPQQPLPPARLIPGTKDPILSTGPPKDAEDWKLKNARAKELIMSTLVPGSEPWKIAEPLELASDIWKALEARYAPVNEQTRPEASQVQSNQTSPTTSGSGLPWKVSADDPRNEGTQVQATKEFYDSMPSRDQRFLWALLYGGKEETNAWFYGISDRT